MGWCEIPPHKDSFEFFLTSFLKPFMVRWANHPQIAKKNKITTWSIHINEFNQCPNFIDYYPRVLPQIRPLNHQVYFLK